MSSQYNLQLRATLDTQQVQQQLQQLRAAQMSASNGQSTAKGAQIGMGSFSKLDATLTKLNSSVNALQRTIENLNKINQQSFTALTKNGSQKASNGIPIAPNSSGKLSFITRKWRSAYDSVVKSDPSLKAKAIEKYGTDDPDILGEMYAKKFDTDKYNANLKDRKFVQGRLQQIHKLRQNRQIAALFGGQLIGGAGDLLTAFGQNRTGAVVSGIGQGITAGGAAAYAASMAGLGGSAAGPIGIVVGLAAAIPTVVSSLNQLEEAAKKAAEQQEKVAEALKTTAISQSQQKYNLWQQMRAEEVKNQNNLPVAKEREAYFKKEFEKARNNVLLLKDPVEFEKQTREAAEKKKNATVTERRAVTGGGTATGGYYTTIEEYQRQKTDEEKAEIDKAANEAIEAQQKKFAAAQKELQAADANYQLWKETADSLQNSKDAEEKASREAKNAESAQKRRYKSAVLDFAEQRTWADRVNGTQSFAFDVLNDKTTGPLEKFNKIAEELDTLRLTRNGLLSDAYNMNRDIQLNGESMTPAQLKDLISRRDHNLSEADSVGEQTRALENALMHIRTSNLAPDLSHVTSLAQYGFNMGEKDDTVERMDKYYTRSINLQEQIKNKLQEGIKTEATYSE